MTKRNCKGNTMLSNDGENFEMRKRIHREDSSYGGLERQILRKKKKKVQEHGKVLKA